MHDNTERTSRRRRRISPWWIWPLAVLTLGWALMLGAHAWSLEDRQVERAPATQPTRGRALVEDSSDHDQQVDASTALAHWHVMPLEP